MITKRNVVVGLLSILGISLFLNSSGINLNTILNSLGPFLFLGACLGMHFFMHKNHSGHGKESGEGHPMAPQTELKKAAKVETLGSREM